LIVDALPTSVYLPLVDVLALRDIVRKNYNHYGATPTIQTRIPYSQIRTNPVEEGLLRALNDERFDASEGHE
jgi:hypothetical protein